METYCLLNLKKGDELRIITKTGRKFRGILYDIKEGYLHTVESLGIIIIFPINSLASIQLT